MGRGHINEEDVQSSQDSVQVSTGEYSTGSIPTHMDELEYSLVYLDFEAHPSLDYPGKQFLYFQSSMLRKLIMLKLVSRSNRLWHILARP